MKSILFTLLYVVVTLQENLEVPPTTTDSAPDAEVDLIEIRKKHAEDVSHDEKKRKDLIKEKDNLMTLLKTLHYSCIVLARFQLSSYGNELMEFLERYPDQEEQNIVWKKIYTTHVTLCQKNITYDDSVKIFTAIKANEFDFGEYTGVFEGMSLQKYEGIVPNETEFTKDEIKTWKFIEVPPFSQEYQDFEKSLKDKQMEQEDDDDLMIRARRLQNLDLEPKVFGFELKFSKTTQLICLILFIGAVGTVMYFALQKLRLSDEKQKRQGKKRR